MAASTTNETWDEAWTLSMRAKRKRLTDNISDSYPTIDKFRKSGILETEVGGKEIQEDLMYALDTSQWFDGYDTLNTDATDGVTAAFFNWRYLATPITISMTEEKESRKSDSAGHALAGPAQCAVDEHAHGKRRVEVEESEVQRIRAGATQILARPEGIPQQGVSCSHKRGHG